MQDLKCPVCKSDSYLIPDIKILISPCFHKLCEQCVYRIFSRGPAPCPVCKTPLRRVNFIASTFEDVEVAREINIRRIMHRYFTRASSEFESQERYNDYLEEFEDKVLELLKTKNETLVREMVEAIKNTGSILNPRNVVEKRSRNTEENEAESKKIKVEEATWTVFTKESAFIPPTPLYIPSPDILIPFPAAGPSLKDINRILFLSLKNNC